MFNYQWKILELFADCKGVKYLASATDDKNTIQTEGNCYFQEGIVNLPFDQIKEQNLIDWIDKDAIKSNLEAQLKALESNKKVDFPWLADTFTPNS
jgi:hypothetical protein